MRQYFPGALVAGLTGFHYIFEISHVRNHVDCYFQFQIAPLVHQSCDTLSQKLEKIAESGEKVDMWRSGHYY